MNTSPANLFVKAPTNRNEAVTNGLPLRRYPIQPSHHQKRQPREGKTRVGSSTIFSSRVYSQESKFQISTSRQRYITHIRHPPATLCWIRLVLSLQIHPCIQPVLPSLSFMRSCTSWTPTIDRYAFQSSFAALLTCSSPRRVGSQTGP